MKICYHCMAQIKNGKQNKCPVCGKSLDMEPVDSRYLKPGTLLNDKYVVGYPLGNGGFGNTYIGWDEVLSRKVTIKEFYPEQYISRSNNGNTVTVTTEQFHPRFRKGLQQFIREGVNIMALSDINGVVDILGYFEANGTGYIIMEYLEGVDVSKILKDSGGRKDYEWCKRVILTVLYTLREVHKRGVLHRDISPDNIFITNEGVVKLIDFGAARYAAASNELTTAVVLKNGYAPIEQYSKSAPQTPCADIYSVAATFYRMLTGQKPLSAIDRLSDDRLITPSEMGIELPEQAELAIMVCLNVQPQYRLQSADEFIQALGGENFVPNYDSKWVLPPVKESSYNSVPLGLKILVASLILIMAIGAGLLLVFNPPKGGSVEEDSFTLEDYTNQSYEDIKEDDALEGIEIVPKYVYDPANDGKIVKQSLPSKVLTSGEKYGDITFADGKATGTLTVRVASKDYIAYSDIREKWRMHVDQMKKDIGLKEAQMDAKEEERGPYNTIIEMKVNSAKGVITADDIEAGDDYIKIADIEKISYYAKNFFYWDRFDDYVGKNINDVKEQPVYDINFGRRAEDGTDDITKDPAMVDSGWYSFDKESGYIFRQNAAPGTTVDCSEELPADMVPLLCVVGDGNFLAYTGTGKSLKEQLENLGFTNIEFSGSGNKKHKVSEILISYSGDEDVYYKDDDGNIFFKIDNGIKFNIVTKEPVTEAPRPTPSPTPAPAPDI